MHFWGCIFEGAFLRVHFWGCIFEGAFLRVHWWLTSGALVIWAAYLRVHWWSWVLRANRKFTEVSRLNITKTWNATHSTFWLIVSCWTEVHHEELLPFVLPEGQKHILGLTAQDMRAFFFCTLFFFPKRKVCTSFLFYGQAVRPGLIAFQAVRPEVHTGPGRKSWTSLYTPQAVRPEVYTPPQPEVVVEFSFSFCTSGRKAWSAYWSSP